MGDHLVYSGRSAFTIEAWVRLASVPSGCCEEIASNFSGPSSRTGYELTLSNDGFSLTRWYSGSKEGVTAVSPSLVANRWYYVVATYDGSTMSLYVDDALRESQPSTSSLPGWTGNLTIGNVAWGGEQMDGTLDEVAVYGTALSAAHMRNHWVAGLGTAPAMRPKVAADHPVGNRRLNEPAGSIAALDSSGDDVDCSYEYPTLGVAGAIDGDSSTAASFKGSGADGTSDRVVCDNSFGEGGTRPFSVEVWVKPSSLTPGTYEYFAAQIDQIDNQKSGWALDMSTTYGFALERWVNGTHSSAVSYGHLVTGQWYDVVATYDGTSSHIYLDGRPGESATDGASVPTTTEPFTLGDPAVDWEGGNAFAGSIDEAAVYDHVLSPARVAAHYAAFLGGNDLPYGKLKRFSISSQQLDDHLSLGVNLANGELLLDSNDVHLNGVAGNDVTVDGVYNSFDARFSELGPGWQLSTGADVRLTLRDDGSIEFDGPTGERVVFGESGSSYSSPQGIDWTLVGDGNPTGSCAPSGGISGSAYTLCANGGDTKLEFDRNGRLLAQETDNTTSSNVSSTAVTFAYNGDGTLASLTDSHGGSTSFSYDGEGALTTITDPGNRTYKYASGTNDNLTSYTDPAGAVTSFGYDPSTNELTQVVDPNDVATRIAYEANGRVSTITRGLDPSSGGCLISGGACPVSTFTYPAVAGPCPAGASSETQMQDPDGNTTTYCLDSRGRVTDVYDPDGHHHGSDYTSGHGGSGCADDNVCSTTDALGRTTTFGYDSLNNLDWTQSPLEGSTNRPTFAYGSAGGAYQYKITSYADPQGTTTAPAAGPATSPRAARPPPARRRSASPTTATAPCRPQPTATATRQATATRTAT